MFLLSLEGRTVHCEGNNLEDKLLVPIVWNILEQILAEDAASQF